MADAWGGSWGTAWGSSWGTGSNPVVPEVASLSGGRHQLHTKRHHKRLYDEREAQKLAIRALYEEAVTVPAVAAEAGAIVRKHARSDAEIPELQAVDWQAMQADIDRANQLTALWIGYLRKRADEDEIEREDEMILFGIER